QRFNGSAWELVGPAGFSDGEAYWTSLAVDGSGVPYLAYQDVANENRATVQKFNGSDWEVVGPVGLSLYTGAVSLLLDASGVPYVAYQDSTKEGKATVQRFNGNAWEVVGNAGFSGGQALFTDLA
ncbi:hypothetical protein MWU78_22295, partial [Arenibacter sp. F26102]|uniref:hypothetical protein n=1 Tax=Arenibacter sp. F26102 TaxID=2926416 RepID=UPI001FF3C9A8